MPTLSLEEAASSPSASFLFPQAGKGSALQSKTSYLDFFLNPISQEQRRAFLFFPSPFKKEIRSAKNFPVDEHTVILMPSPTLAFCLLSPLPSVYIILGHLSWRSYWLKDANCLRSCISSCCFFQVARYVKSIHFCTAVQLHPDTWSLQLSPTPSSLPPPLPSHPAKWTSCQLLFAQTDSYGGLREKARSLHMHPNKHNQNVKAQVKYITVLPCQILLISPG